MTTVVALVFLFAVVVAPVNSNDAETEEITFGSVRLSLDMSRYQNPEKSDKDNCELLVQVVSDSFADIQSAATDAENLKKLCGLDLGFVDNLLESCSEEAQSKANGLIKSYNEMCPQNTIAEPEDPSADDFRAETGNAPAPAADVKNGKKKTHVPDASANGAVSMSKPMLSGFLCVLSIAFLGTYGLQSLLVG